MANKVDALINVKDASGVLNEIYPITKKENVQGLAEFISNSLSGYLPKSGGTLTGKIKGTDISCAWLQITGNNHHVSACSKVAVFDRNNWIHYRTVSELLADLNIPGSDAIHATTEAYGTTKLSTSVTSTSKTTAATPYAVKSALDTAKKYVDDKAPTQRTVTLSSAGWTASGNIYTQTATVSGVSATETAQEIHVTPAIASMSAYMEAGVYASAQAANQITFTASEKPTADLTVYAVIRTL